MEFRQQPNTKRLVQVLLELSLVSHVSGTSYDSSSSGGRVESKIPTGGIDRHGDREAEFRQKSADHFARRLQNLINGLDRLSNEKVEQLRDELLDQSTQALKDWKYTPAVPGHELERFTKRWKVRVANDDRSAGVVAGFYGISRTSVMRYREQYAGLEE